MRSTLLSVLLVFMTFFTILNYVITVYAPNQELVYAAKVKNDEIRKYPLHQDQILYAEVLNKMKTCSVVHDKEKNDFYTCPDKSTISMVHWERDGGKRKGVVTKYYDSTGKHLLVYGHPDDVY